MQPDQCASSSRIINFESSSPHLAHLLLSFLTNTQLIKIWLISITYMWWQLVFNFNPFL